MRKEYRTINEVVGPLMMVENVQGIKYDELAEIEQSSGEIRHGRVLEVYNDKALLQLFEGSQGLRISDAKARFWAEVLSLPSLRICWAGFLTEWAGQRTEDRNLSPISGLI